MIEEPKRLRILTETQRPTSAQVTAFDGLPSSVVSDALWGSGALDPDIAPLRPEMQAAGPALTVECRPGDLLPLLAALKYIRPGDMVICTTQGHRAHATAGDRVCGMMANAGATGFVTEGTLRDANGIEATGLPVWSTGLTPASPVSTGLGRVGHPIQIAGQTVASGDMVIADRDGVVIVPFAKIDATAARAREIIGLEDALDAQVRDGLILPPAIDDLLNSDEVSFDT